MLIIESVVQIHDDTTRLAGFGGTKHTDAQFTYSLTLT
jgi:hypothetical protein